MVICCNSATLFINTSLKRMVKYYGVATLKAWLETMDTAVVNAALVYMLLKQFYSDKGCFPKHWLSPFSNPVSSPFRILVMSVTSVSTM